MGGGGPASVDDDESRGVLREDLSSSKSSARPEITFFGTGKDPNKRSAKQSANMNKIKDDHPVYACSLEYLQLVC